MTRQTLTKQVKTAIDKRLDEHGLLLVENLSSEIASDVAAIVEERKRHAKKGVCPQEWMIALYRLCGINPVTVSPGLRLQISECGQALILADAEIGQLDPFLAWWRDFTSKWSTWSTLSRFPSPKQVRDHWGKFCESNRPSTGHEAIPSDIAHQAFAVRL